MQQKLAYFIHIPTVIVTKSTIKKTQNNKSKMAIKSTDISKIINIFVRLKCRLYIA